jgi:hypothetical protein
VLFYKLISCSSLKIVDESECLMAFPRSLSKSIMSLLSKTRSIRAILILLLFSGVLKTAI